MHPGQVVAAFLAFLMFAGVGGVLAAGLLMPMVAAAGSVTQASSELFDDLPSELGSEDMSEQTVLLDRNGDVLARFYMWNRIVVPMDKIDPIMSDAVIAVEDHRFYDHGGIDTEGLMRAAFTNLSGGDLQGGSTLTQQYVKNVLVEHSRISDDQEAYIQATDTTLGRKLREAKLAISLEKSRTKDEILEGYLNIAQFGASVWGVEAASRNYFSHSAEELTPAEAALLAGITNAPNKYDPLLNPDNALERRDRVLKRMLDQGFINEEEYEEGINTDLEDMLDVNETPSGCVTAKESAYFCDYVKRVIQNDEIFGETRADRTQLLMQGGLTIKTTIDPEMQKQAKKSLEEYVPENDPSGISNAISTVEAGTGEILAMTQNTTYGKKSKKNRRSTELNFNTNSEYGGSTGFQSGSTFKAFVLTAWLESGKSLQEMVQAPPQNEFARHTWNYDGCFDYRDDYKVTNIEQSASRLSVLDATRRSSNTGYVYMANQLNMCDIGEVAESMGVHRASGPDEQGNLLKYNPSFVLGTNEIAPLSMAAAFATYAANGTYCEPVAIISITDSDGNELPVPEANCREVISKDVSAGVTHALQAVTDSSGTANQAGIPGRPTAGKTGTSNNNYDAWFVGYVPQAATAVWVGHSEGQESMNYQTIGGRHYGQVYGGAIAAPIWRSYMEPVTKDWEAKDFPSAPDKMVYGERKQVPSVLGQSIDKAEDILNEAGFDVKVGKKGYSDRYPEGVVGWQSSLGRERPGSTITIRPSAGEEPSDSDDKDSKDSNDSKESKKSKKKSKKEDKN